MFLGVIALGVVLAGCASGRKHRAALRATTVHVTPVSRKGPRIAYPAVGVTLTPPPAGYRPAVSRTKVLTLLRHTTAWRFIKPKRNLTARAQRVSEGRPGRDAFPAWVVTNRRPGSNCVFVSIYSLRSRAWIWHFRSCTHRTSPPSCDFGCTPANQDALDAAASAAKRIAAQAYFTGVEVDDPSNRVTVYLAHAPSSILARLGAAHPGMYVIHDDAPRTLRDVMRIMRSLSFAQLRARGIEVTGYGPTVDGYLQVGVSNGVAGAQARLDAIYGRNVIRVVKQPMAVAY
jgi:hypothetical protein